MIGYIPVLVVGTLIYYLGIDLLQEALWTTFGTLQWLEYFTVRFPLCKTFSALTTDDVRSLR